MKPLSCFITRSFLLAEGQYSKCDEMDKVGAILNWLGPKSFEVYEDLAMEPGEDKKKCVDVLKDFEYYFRPSNPYSKTGTSWVDSILGHVSPRMTS